MLDMHAHLLCLSDEYRGRLTEQEMTALAARELALRRKSGIDTVFSCGTPQEWEFMERCLSAGNAGTERQADEEDFSGEDPAGTEFFLSFGIHPWNSGCWEPGDCFEYYKETPVIGEIGMDSVWTAVPLGVQRRVFAQQLEIAAQLRKPVLLHTKGQEAQIAEMIRDFPEKVCVHWYSGDEKIFEKFLEMGCCFTLGPDLAEKLEERSCLACDRSGRSAALYRRILRETPADRLFLETDGLSSIAWMRGQSADEVSFSEISAVLDRNLNCAAREKHMDPGKLLIRMQENLQSFLQENFRKLTR